MFDLLLQRKALEEAPSKVIFYQLVSAVAYLHEHGVVHRDLKVSRRVFFSMMMVLEERK